MNFNKTGKIRFLDGMKLFDYDESKSSDFLSLSITILSKLVLGLIKLLFGDMMQFVFDY